MHSLGSGNKLASHDTLPVDSLYVEDSSPDSSQASSHDVETLSSTPDHSDQVDQDEAEILAIIKDQIPRYRLCSEADDGFSGCSYNSASHTETLTWDRDIILSPGEAAESLNQFVLCAERVSEMTRTCDDLEALAHLLEEKERDLELTARIGQTLLSKNKELSNRVESLEDQLSSATEKVNQLRHDLSKRDELLKYFSEDLEQDVVKETVNNSALDPANVDFLENKVKILEDENLNLRIESAQLRADTDSYEEKEKKLVEDCIQQLAEVNLQVESLTEELHQKAEENSRHKEEALRLLSQVTDLQKKIRKLTLENMDMREKLTASSESQWKLTQELGGMKDKYDELLEMLEEAQDELQLMRSRDRVHSSRQHHDSAYADSTDSLASELEMSLQQELSQPNRRYGSWKVFETARAAKQAAAKAVEREALSATRMSLAPPVKQSEAYTSDMESIASDSCSIDMDNLYECNPELGRPGIPGSTDLESALKRLALRRANEQNEKDFQEQEQERRKKDETDMADSASQMGHNGQGPPVFPSPLGSVSSRWSSPGMSIHNQHYRLPEKLQIVKPMEGSVTLRHWQQLATPHLGGIFEEREGVQMKGSNRSGQTDSNNSFSDFEEDDHSLDVHTRREQGMGLIYTFTDSTVRNPGSYIGQNSNFNSSVPGNSAPTDISTEADNQAERMPTLPSEGKLLQMSPQHKLLHKVDNTQSTFSMSLGLAALLQGREPTGSAVTRVSTSKPITTTSDPPVTSSTSISNSDLNQTYFTSRSFDSQPLTSTPKLVFGSRSFDHAMIKKGDNISPIVDSGAPKETEPGVTGKSFLQQLKIKGYSLYSLWGGGEKSNQTSPESSADGVSIEDNSNTSTSISTAEPVFANGANGGVLGALTNFRRSGML